MKRLINFNEIAIWKQGMEKPKLAYFFFKFRFCKLAAGGPTDNEQKRIWKNPIKCLDLTWQTPVRDNKTEISLSS